MLRCVEGQVTTGLDQVSADWPTTDVSAGSTLEVDFLVTANHEPGGSVGVLCLGPPYGRFVQQVVDSGASGSVSIDVDLMRLPRPTGPIAVRPGETWDFQLWFRDSVGGTATSNFTDAVEVTFS